jgi:hypothetical protein
LAYFTLAKSKIGPTSLFSREAFTCARQNTTAVLCLVPPKKHYAKKDSPSHQTCDTCMKY